MDKYTTFKTINNMLGKKHKFALSFSEEASTLICKCETEQIHRVMFDLYATRNSSDEFVKKSIANINEETRKPIGFGISK